LSFFGDLHRLGARDGRVVLTLPAIEAHPRGGAVQVAKCRPCAKGHRYESPGLAPFAGGLILAAVTFRSINCPQEGCWQDSPSCAGPVTFPQQKVQPRPALHVPAPFMPRASAVRRAPPVIGSPKLGDVNNSPKTIRFVWNCGDQRTTTAAASLPASVGCFASAVKAVMSAAQKLLPDWTLAGRAESQPQRLLDSLLGGPMFSVMSVNA
jgi:hypothetical protein